MPILPAPGGTVSPASNGLWYIEYYTDSGGNLQGRIVQSVNPPAVSGDIDSISPGFATQAAAQAQLNQNAPLLGGPVSGFNPANPVGGVTSILGETGPKLTNLSAIGDFFQRLTQANTWERVAVFGIGTILIIAGMMKLLDSDKTFSEVVKTGAKAALA